MDAGETSPDGDDAATTDARSAVETGVVDFDASNLQPVGQDLAPTGDFEADTDAGCGSDWYAYQGVDTRTHGDGHDGSAFFCSVCPHGTVDLYTLGEESFYMPAAGERYRATAWVRGNQSSPAMVTVHGRVWNDQQASLSSAFDQPSAFSVDPDGVWHQIGIDFEVPQFFQTGGGGVDAYIQLDGLHGDGSCIDLDDFAVYKLQ